MGINVLKMMTGGSAWEKGRADLGRGIAVSEAAQKEDRELASGAATDFDPYEAFGERQMGRLEELQDDPSSIFDSPGFKSMMSEAMRGVRQSAGAAGKMFSSQRENTAFAGAGALANQFFQQERGFLASGVGVGLRAASGSSQARLGQADVALRGGGAVAGMFQARGQMRADQAQSRTTANNQMADSVMGMFSMGGGCYTAAMIYGPMSYEHTTLARYVNNPAVSTAAVEEMRAIYKSLEPLMAELLKEAEGGH